MYNIGDKLMYPMHGAGIVEAIEEKEILGNKKKYYILNICTDEIHVMIPIENADSMGIRPVISQAEAQEVIRIFKEKPTAMERAWTKRYRDNEEKIKRGNPHELAEIVKNLSYMDHKKKLSAGEKKILLQARHILVSEMMLAMDEQAGTVENMLDELMKCRKDETL